MAAGAGFYDVNNIYKYGETDSIALFSDFLNVGQTSISNVVGDLKTNTNTSNAVINGAFDIWQRGTSVASGAGATYAADRWAFGASGASGRTVSRQTTGFTAFQYCARVQRNSGQTNTNVNYYAQNIESINSIPFAGKTVTVSYYARAGANYSSSSNALSLTVYSGTGTDQNFINVAITGQATVATSSATLTTSWQRFTATGTVSSAANQLFVVVTNTPSGTASTNDYYEITGVQLEAGATATTFRRNSPNIQAELAACQRYYFRKYAETSYGIMSLGYGLTGGYHLATIQFPTTMRAIPSSTLDWSGATSAFQVKQGNSSRTVSATAPFLETGTNGSLSTNNANVIFTITGGTDGMAGPVTGNNNAAAYLGFSAEL